MNWLQLAYQYGVGGLFFAFTLLLCLGPGRGNLRNPSDRNAFIALLAGLLGYLALTATWILLASV
jgi:hypothetical protein